MSVGSARGPTTGRRVFAVPRVPWSGWARRGSRPAHRVSVLWALLLAGDLAVALSVLLVGPLDRGEGLLVLGGVLLCRMAVRLHRPRLRLAWFDDLSRVLVAAAGSLGVAIAIEVALRNGDPPVRDLVVTVGLFLVLGEVPRALGLATVRTARRRFARGERTLVIGDGQVGSDLAATMLAHPEFGLRPVGLFGTEARAEDAGSALPVLDSELGDVVGRHRVTTVVMTWPVGEPEAVDMAVLGRQLGCDVLVLPTLFELYRDGGDVERLRSFPLVRLYCDPTRRPSWRVKRVLDASAAAVALVVLLPVMGVLAAAVLLDGGRPVLFSQERIGLGGRPFRLHKFRSLTPKTPTESATRWSIDGDPEVSWFGRTLRRTSLDELPQIWNVLRGDMSVVGPRPERPAFVERFSLVHREYAARHRVPAGITGLAQVNGLRGDTSIADRARYDNYYIANWSLWLDVRIVLLTAGELLRHARR